MRLRLFAMLVLVLILCTILPVSPSATPTLPSLNLVILAPPAGIELPQGQGVEVRCRLTSTTGSRTLAGPVSLEILVNGISLRRREVALEETASLGWIPTRQGAHTLQVMAYLDGRPVAQAQQQMFVGPAGTPVHVP